MESGAWEESVSDARRLLSEDGSGFYLYIRGSSEGRGPLRGGFYLTRNRPNRPYIYLFYKLVPKVCCSLPRASVALARVL